MAELPLHFRSATELGRMIADRQVSSVELTILYLDRLDKQGRTLNAVAELTRDLALAQAKQADQELAAGRRRGPLHGVPWGAKDLLATAGIPTRWGSPAHRDQIFDHDAAVVQRLRDAGAVLVAKLTMVELAGGGGYDHAIACADGPGRCPWDPQRWSGGSSSGPGAAVGGGLVGFAIGSETWGSITCPSAFCGVTGLRPTYGRVSRSGAMALSWTLDKLGPMARSAEDCGHILQIIAGPDPHDPASAEKPFTFRPEPATSPPARPIRLGLLKQDFSRSPHAQQCFSTATEVFRSLGFILKDTDFPPGLPYGAIASQILTAESAASFENLLRSDRLNELADPGQALRLAAGLAMPAVDYLRAMRLRSRAMQLLNTIWNDHDILVAPTLLAEAPFIDAAKRRNEPGGGNGGPPNLAGWPSISLPMGLGRDGLPLGLELIGPPCSEQLLLSLAMTYQSHTPWHLRTPNL